MPKPTPYRISTITATASLGVPFDLVELFDKLCADKVTLIHRDISHVEYGKKRYIEDVEDIKTQKAKRFDNQITILFRDDDKRIYVSTKIFKNGNLQMTGIKNNDQGKYIVLRTKEIVAPDLGPEVTDTFKVQLINSDFKAGFPIRRDLLYRIISNEYDNISSYESCIYPGVKIEYYHNVDSVEKNGVCPCEHPCVMLKRCRGVKTKCKRVTIAVFESGSVIITGAEEVSQIDEVYAFITGVMERHKSIIEKKILEATDSFNTKKPVVMLNRKNVIYPTSLM